MRLIDADALKDPLELQRASYARIGATERAAAYANVLWEIAQAPTVGGWISVKDRLPNHNNRVPVLYRFKQAPDELITSMMWYVREPFCGDEPPHWERFGNLETEVLYWYELPEIPKEAGT